MNSIDRKWLEVAFGTNPTIFDLEYARDTIDEWITEILDEDI